MTEQKFDPSTYELLGTVDVTKVFYGGSATTLNNMADMARNMGAEAVIEVDVWFKPAGWAWASPQGSGKAVVFKPEAKVDLSKIPGEYR